MSESDNKVNGLRTPALTDGEFVDSASEFPVTEEPTQKSTLDIASSIEAKVKALLERVEKDDAEVNERMAKLVKKVEQLRKEIAN